MLYITLFSYIWLGLKFHGWILNLTVLFNFIVHVTRFVYCLYMYILMSDLKFTRDSVIIVCFFSTLTKAYCIVGNGGWSNWTTNSTCSVTCGEGITLDTRSCTNPPPNDIGTSCVGESHYEEVCKKKNCACEFIRKRKNAI
jgi:hypothetical protein